MMDGQVVGRIYGWKDCWMNNGGVNEWVDGVMDRSVIGKLYLIDILTSWLERVG